MAIKLHEWYVKFCEVHGLEPDIERAKENMGQWKLKFQIENAQEGVYADNYENVLCLPLIEFSQWQKNTDEFTDFVYDKTTGYVIVNFRYNSGLYHELFTSSIVNAIENTNVDEKDGAEKYIDKYGFFKSSAGGYGPWKRVYIGANFKITADIKLAFKGYEFVRIED